MKKYWVANNHVAKTTAEGNACLHARQRTVEDCCGSRWNELDIVVVVVVVVVVVSCYYVKGNTTCNVRSRWKIIKIESLQRSLM